MFLLLSGLKLAVGLTAGLTNCLIGLGSLATGVIASICYLIAVITYHPVLGFTAKPLGVAVTGCINVIINLYVAARTSISGIAVLGTGRSSNNCLIVTTV